MSEENYPEGPFALEVNPYSPEVKDLINALLEAGYSDHRAAGVLLSTLAGMTREMGLEPSLVAMLLQAAHAGMDAQEAAEKADAEREADVLKRARRLN